MLGMEFVEIYLAILFTCIVCCGDKSGNIGKFDNLANNAFGRGRDEFCPLEMMNLSTNIRWDPRFMTPCPLHKKPLELRAIGITELTLSTGLFVVNCVFLILLYKRRGVLNWKMNVYALNLALSDVFSSLALLIMSISIVILSQSGRRWCIGSPSPQPEWVEIGVQAVVTCSVCLTVLNYNLLILAQYCAIRAPIFHRTYCSTRRFRYALIFSQWIIVLAYVGTKSLITIVDGRKYAAEFSIFELTFMGLSILWSVGAYSYVLHVAKTWQKRRLSRQKAVLDRLASTSDSITPRPESEGSVPGQNADGMRRRRILSSHSLSVVWVSIWQRYQTITNAGIHLSIYVLACVPMWLVRVWTLADLGHNSASMYDVYSCASVWCSVTVCLWFFRGVLDPLIYACRNPEILRATNSVAPVAVGQQVNTLTRVHTDDSNCQRRSEMII